MRKSVNRTPPEVALNRVLAGLEKEVVEAADEEIELAAAELGMNVKMKGSAAFIGVLYTVPRRIEDIFDVEVGQPGTAHITSPRGTRSYLPKTGKKDRGDDEK